MASNLERVARDLAPVSAMASALDAAAVQAAADGEDPSPPPGFAAGTWGGNWAWGFQDPLEVLYFWMYDDGLGSPNKECSASDPNACWSHRNNILIELPCAPCVAGAASETMPADVPSMTELIAETYGSPLADFTWAQEVPYLPTRQLSENSRSHAVRPDGSRGSRRSKLRR